jgi:hypothetical protein
VPSLHPITDSEVIFEADGLIPDHLSNGDRFINANDVVSFLASKSPRYVSRDALELTIDDSRNGILDPMYVEGQSTFPNMELFSPPQLDGNPRIMDVPTLHKRS